VNQYLLLKSLGQGSHGKVKLSLNTHDSCLYAMKIIDKALLRKKRFGSRAAMNDAMREIAIMKRLAHPNIVALHEVSGARCFVTGALLKRE
jgi:serine/threonine protein kinase